MTRAALLCALLGSALVLTARAPGQPPQSAKANAWDVEAPHGPAETVELDLEEGTWMNLDVSPDGERIVFDLLGDIYVMDARGGEARALLSGPAFTVQPRFGPDGRRIAFTSDAGGGDNLWVMNADGSDPRPVTKERFRLLNNPAWTPDGRWLIGRKHFTARRSLGAGELWMYDARGGGAGVRLTKRKNDQQDLGEPEVSPDGRWVYFSEDVSPGPTFRYNRDPNGVIYAIRRLDLDTGEIETVCREVGGSARPELSPDGERLAFVRRIRGKTCLVVRRLATGEERIVYRELSKDGQETWCIFGVYPNFAWMPDGRHIVVWARGKIRSIDVRTGRASVIPFRVRARHRITRALRVSQDLGGPDVQVRVVRWPCVAPDGAVVFEALGKLWVREPDAGAPRRLTDSDELEYWPELSPDGRRIVYVTWSDERAGRVVLLDRRTGERRVIVDEPGHYACPSFSPDGARIVYQRLAQGSTRGKRFTTDPGIWTVDPASGRRRRIRRTTAGVVTPRFHPVRPRITFLDREGEDVALASVDLLGSDRRVLATSKRATEIVLSPDGRHVAWVEGFHVWLAPMPRAATPLRLAPDSKEVPVRRLSEVGGEFVRFLPSGGGVQHSLAATLRIDDLAEKDPTHVTLDLGFTVPADRPETNVLLVNARVVTMEGERIHERGAVHVRGNRIVAVGPAGEVRAPGARRLDLEGMTVLPGFLDAHAHMPTGNAGMLPGTVWAHLANLAFGVTTTHDPSHDTKMVFAAAERERTGDLLAPRIFSTGTILYGAEAPFKAEIDDLDDARRHLRRLAAFGAFTVKSYNQPRRDQRQQILAAARELGLMVVPEGGSMFFHNLTMILDGHTTIEHALPVAPLYEDVLGLFAASETAYDPTLVVGYGGLWGEHYWYQTTDVWRNRRLLRFVPRAVVDPVARRRPKVPPEEFWHDDLARAAAELARRGVPVSVSAHGQMQGLCSHWDLWMFAQGGLSPLEALRCATVHPARALGLDEHLGSLRPGKLADLIVLEQNPLENIRFSTSIRYVMKNGRLYDARTLAQVLPDRRPPPRLPPVGLSDPAGAVTPRCCGGH